MEIISRARWGARHDRGFGPAPLPAAEVWLHHSVTLAPDLVWIDADRDGVEDDEERAMRTLEDIGEQRFGGGISYTFAVMPSGRIYEGHGVDRQGAHTANRNDIARAIVLVGNYDTHKPTEAQVYAAARLLRHGHTTGWWRHPRLNGGHQQAPGASTACPGQHAMAVIDTINHLAAGPPITEKEEDMPTIDEILNAKVERKGSRLGGTTSLRAMLAWYDAGLERSASATAAVSGKVDGLAEAVGQIAAGQQLDLDAVTAAAEAGTRKALAEGTVHVDVDVTGPGQEVTF